jgi:hypothetical protein
MDSVHSVTEHRQEDSFIQKLVWKLMPLLALLAATLTHCAILN